MTTRVLRNIVTVRSAFQALVDSLQRRRATLRSDVNEVPADHRIGWHLRESASPPVRLRDVGSRASLLYVGRLESNVWLTSLLERRTRLRAAFELDELLFMGDGPLAPVIQRSFVTVSSEDARGRTTPQAPRLRDLCARPSVVVLGPDPKPCHIESAYPAILAGAVLVDADVHSSTTAGAMEVSFAIRNAVRLSRELDADARLNDRHVHQSLRDLATVEQRVKVAQIIRALPQ